MIPAYEVYHKVHVTRSGKEYDKSFLDSPRREKSNFNCFYSGSTETDNSQLNSSGESTSLLEVELVGAIMKWKSGCSLPEDTWQTMSMVRVPTMMKVVLVKPRGTYFSDGVSEC